MSIKVSFRPFTYRDNPVFCILGFDIHSHEYNFTYGYYPSIHILGFIITFEIEIKKRGKRIEDIT